MWSKLGISKNISQAGLPVLWTMAGNIDKVNNTYRRHFFKEVFVLALVASEKEVRKRMEIGRGITDVNWIQGSVDYNNYFVTHKSIGDMPFEILNTDGKNVEEVAEKVKCWMLSCLHSE